MLKKLRFPLTVGPAIGLALAASANVARALEPRLGVSGSILVGLIAAAFTGGAVALLLNGLLEHPRILAGKKPVGDSARPQSEG